MTITIDPALESYVLEHAHAEGLTVDAYMERLIRANQSAEEELETLALEGIQSGPPFEVDAEYWAAKHRQLDERLRAARAQ